MWLYILSLWMKPQCVTIQMKAIKKWYRLFLTMLQNEIQDFFLSFELLGVKGLTQI